MNLRDFLKHKHINLPILIHLGDLNINSELFKLKDPFYLDQQGLSLEIIVEKSEYQILSVKKRFYNDFETNQAFSRHEIWCRKGDNNDLSNQ